MQEPRIFRIVSLSLLLSLAASCASTTASIPTESQWLEPSPRLRTQIEDSAQRLPWTHGMERVDLIMWFAGVGEPAYPTLLEMALDPRKDVAGSALAALGATKDSRLVEPLRSLPWPPGDEKTDMGLERARTLLRLGDWQMVPVLISGLSDDRLLTRALCSQALFESTRERFGYDAKSDGEARAKSIALWEAWWEERRNDPIQQGREMPNVATRAK